MGMIYVCDTCGKETPGKDMHIVKIDRVDNTPSMKPLEICVFCKEKVVEALKKITEGGL